MAEECEIATFQELFKWFLALFVTLLCTACVVVYAWYRLYYAKQRRSFENRVCMVVGAAKGIGQACAVTLAQTKNCSHVLLVDMATNCDDTVRMCYGEVKGDRTKIMQFQCDITNETHLDQLVQCIKAEPDIDFVYSLIDCAGIVSGRKFEDLTVSEFNRVLNVNLGGNFALLKRFLPEMLKRNEGCVVGISSLMGLMGASQLSDYCSSKFGLVGLYEALRLEFISSHPNVSFVTVCPYAVDTGMFDGIFEGTRLTRLIRYVFPLLKTEDVSSAIILAAERGTAVAIVPFFFGPLLNVVRCLPSPIYEFVLTLMGGRDGMRNFRGTSALWPPAVAESFSGKEEIQQKEVSTIVDPLLVVEASLAAAPEAPVISQRVHASCDSLREYAVSLTSLSSEVNEAGSSPLPMHPFGSLEMVNVQNQQMATMSPKSSSSGSQEGWSEVPS